jgi:glycerol-3-phosphate dehydrogenase (NAD(P)+)
MTLKDTSEKAVGVVGAGSFGTAVANILANKTEVLLYARKPEIADRLIKTRESQGQKLSDNIYPTNDLELLAKECDVVFPVVPSENFPEMIMKFSNYLKPYHILIHGTKGLFVSKPNWEDPGTKITGEDICTMSKLIQKETLVVRIGCLAGPNLATELAANQPAATVVASHFDEVIREGQRLLRNDRFQVYGSKEIFGVELTGVLKNIIAIGAGALEGMGYGENAKSLLISRGLIEMIYLGRMLGANTNPFFGLAGLGDLVATCSSPFSRNFTVGKRLAEGESIGDIMESMEEVAEGVNTVKVVKRLAETYQMRSPITETLYKVLWEELSIEDALKFLMKSPFSIDIDLL